MIGLYGASIGIVVGGLAVLLGFPFALITAIPAPHILTSISFGIGLIGLGVLGIILSVYLTKGFFRLTVKYAAWNAEFVNR